MRATAALAVLYPLAACTPRDEAAPPPAGAEGAVEPAPRDRTLDPVSVQFHVVGEVPRKPPLMELQVDVVVLNHATESHWVLLPRRVGERPLETGGVEVLEVEQWGGAVAGAWLGRGGFRGVLVGPDARVQLDRMPVEWWRDDGEDDDGDGAAGDAGRSLVHHPEPPLEAIAARELVIDGLRAAELFPADPTVPGPNRGGTRGDVIATVRHRDDGAEVAAEILEPIEVRYVPWPRD
jgi:hypothetical protein